MQTEQPRVTLQKDSFAATFEHSALIDIKRVRELTGFQSSTGIYNRLRAGQFPEPIRLSQRCTRWRVRDVINWIDAQAQKAAA